MSGGSIPSFDSTTYRAPHKFHSRIGTQSTVLRKRSPNVEAEREAERGVALSPRPKTWRQDSVQCVKARNDVACQRIDFGIAHDAIGKLGIAAVSGVELGADARARRPKLGVQVKRRLDNAAARIRLTFRGEPFAIGGSLTVFAAMLLFGWLVVRRENTAQALRAFPSPRNSEFRQSFGRKFAPT